MGGEPFSQYSLVVWCVPDTVSITGHTAPASGSLPITDVILDKGTMEKVNMDRE